MELPVLIVTFYSGKTGRRHKAKNAGSSSAEKDTASPTDPPSAKKAKPSSSASVQSLPSTGQQDAQPLPTPSTSGSKPLDNFKIPRRQNPFSQPTIPADLGTREFRNCKFLRSVPNSSFRSNDFLPSNLIDIDKLCSNFETLVVNSVTASSWGKHKSAWKLFSRFCIAQKCTEIWPVDVKTIRAFAVWAISDCKLKHNTVKSYISSMESGHVIRNLACPNFLQDKIVTMILKGAENLPGHTVNYKMSMNPAMLAMLGHYIAISNWTPYSKQLLWSLFLLAFFTSCRMGELVSYSELIFDCNTTLLWDHILFTPDYSGAQIRLVYTKTKKFAGDTVDIFSFDLSNYCPVINILKLRNMQFSMGIFDLHQPVFKFGSGRYVTSRKVNQILKEFTHTMYKDLDLNITGHSFRSSIPTLMATLPFCDKSLSLKDWGRWSSDSYKSYTKNDRKEREILFNMLVPVLNDFWK